METPGEDAPKMDNINRGILFTEWWDKEGLAHVEQGKSLKEVAMYAFMAGRRRGSRLTHIRKESTQEVTDADG